MSKYADELSGQFKDIQAIKKATKDIIEHGGDLAFQKYMDASNVEKIKKEIMRS